MPAHSLLRRAIRSLVIASAAAFPAAAQSSVREIPLGEVHTLRSTILGEDRTLQITLPESYGRTTVRYPVLFHLDGSSHLLHATATTRFLASARNRVPEMIVVAIPNTNRNRDMTPGDGAVAFQRVIAEEIIPWVEEHYRAAPERILVGHSLSGSFTIHTMLNRPELFDRYIAASAPIWRYENFATDASAGLPRAIKAGVTLYLTVGEHENAQLRDGVQRFATTLGNAPAGSVPAWTFVDMPGEDHSSTPQRTLYAGLETIYADWRFPFFEEMAELDALGGVAGMEAHYRR